MPGTRGDHAVLWDTETYSPHPIKSEGWEISTTGTMPRPKVTVSNLDNSFTALVEENDDLTGGIVRRIRTYGNFLDDGPDADPGAHLPIDVFVISRKTEHNRQQISWELCAPGDQEGVTLPRRKVVRDYCDKQTRRWTGSVYDYTNATCPYVGAPKDAEGVDCAPEDEVFSKRITTCCKARFGANAVLPTGAFPGAARIRAR